ncbi:hypothetical protein YC2023_091862 [Brassica napus]
MKLRQEKRVVPDGVNAKVSSHAMDLWLTVSREVHFCRPPIEVSELNYSQSETLSLKSRNGTALRKMEKVSTDHEHMIQTYQKALAEHHNPDMLRSLDETERI